MADRMFGTQAEKFAPNAIRACARTYQRTCIIYGKYRIAHGYLPLSTCDRDLWRQVIISRHKETVLPGEKALYYGRPRKFTDRNLLSARIYTRRGGRPLWGILFRSRIRATSGRELSFVSRPAIYNIAQLISRTSLSYSFFAQTLALWRETSRRT